MKYQHLLVPIDLNAGQRAIETAFDLASHHGASITFMYVIEAVDDIAFDDEEELTAFYSELEAGARIRLSEVSQRFEQAGLEVRPEIVVGQRARVIVQYSATEAVDLIVLESERIDLNRPEKVFDSFSHQVSLFCQCPVMLLK